MLPGGRGELLPQRLDVRELHRLTAPSGLDHLDLEHRHSGGAASVIERIRVTDYTSACHHLSSVKGADLSPEKVNAVKTKITR